MTFQGADTAVDPPSPQRPTAPLRRRPTPLPCIRVGGMADRVERPRLPYGEHHVAETRGVALRLDAVAVSG
jgi:hypothetical protein